MEAAMQSRITSLNSSRVNAFQHRWTFTISSAIVLGLTVFATQAVRAQTFSVIHIFTGGADGSETYFGVIVDRSGDLYGTNFAGGDQSCEEGGCGEGYKITPQHTFSTLYEFKGGSDGKGGDWLTFGPDGTLYGVTAYGGGGGCAGGCGTI